MAKTPTLQSHKLAFSLIGGHDYEFVSTPPSSLECSICLLTLRNPTVISCCGNHFCEQCIGRINGENKPCPLCNDRDYSIMVHKGVMREVNALTVYCPLKHLGCDWTGDLGKVSCHLNIGSRDSGCQFVEMECANKCGTKVLRKDLTWHEKSLCSKKSANLTTDSVEFRLAMDALSQLKKEVKDVKEEKMKLEVDMTNTKLQIQDLKTKVVSLEVAVRQLNGRVQDGEQDKNESKERILRLEDVPQKVFQIEKKQILNLLQLEKFEEYRTKQELKMMSDLLALETRMTPLPPINFTLHNLHYYRKNDFHWQSEPFYAFPCGYKLIVSIYPNGISKGKGNHLSLYVSILGGGYDSQLEWPFKGTVYIQIYNNTARKWQSRKPVEFEGTDSIGFTGKPEGLNSTNPGLGFSQWLSSAELLLDFCHKGMVKFKVERIILT